MTNTFELSKENIENIYDALNDAPKQEEWANRYMEIFNSVKPETKMQLSESMFEIKANLGIRMRAAKALMYLSLREVLSEKEVSNG